MTTISDAGSRSILNDYIRYLVDQNRFYNAADALVSFALELSGVAPGKQTLIQEIAARAQECRERARTAHVINPAQLDDLYAYVRNTLEPLCANLCADIAADHYFLNGQCNVLLSVPSLTGGTQSARPCSRPMPGCWLSCLIVSHGTMTMTGCLSG
jgi:hypothetical protein